MLGDYGPSKGATRAMGIATRRIAPCAGPALRRRGAKQKQVRLLRCHMQRFKDVSGKKRKQEEKGRKGKGTKQMKSNAKE